MAFWTRGRELAEVKAELAEVRAISGVPWFDANRVPGIPFGDGGPAHPSQIAGRGIDGALSLAPVYAAVRVLADGIASLPLIVNTLDADSNPVPYGGPSMFAAGKSPSASPHATLYDWMHQGMASLALEGNAFGYIAVRDGMGYPTVIEWMPPGLVWIDEDETSPVPNPMKVRYYYKGRFIPTEDVLHIRAFTVPGRMRAISPMKAFMGLFAHGMSIQEFGRTWFAGGGQPPGVLKSTTQTIDEQQATAIKRSATRAIQRHESLVIGSDWEYSPVHVSPEESQFIQATQMTATQVAAIYGVDPIRIGGTRGDSMTYSSVEMSTIDLVTTTLRPWVARWEQALWGVLPASRHVKFCVDAATYAAVDATARHAIFKSDREMGYRTTDEMRQTEGLPALAHSAGADLRPLSWTVGSVRGAADLGLSKDGTPQEDLTKLPPATVPGEADTPNLADDSVSVPPLPADAVTVPKLAPPAKAPKAGGEPPSRSLDDVCRAWAAQAMSLSQLRTLRAEAATHALRAGLTLDGYDGKSLTSQQAAYLLAHCRAGGYPAEYRLLAPSNGHSKAAAR